MYYRMVNQFGQTLLNSVDKAWSSYAHYDSWKVVKSMKNARQLRDSLNYDNVEIVKVPTKTRKNLVTISYYKTAVEGEGYTGTVYGFGQLYAACRDISEMKHGVVLGTDNRLVAFKSEYNDKVTPGCDATEDEREAIKDFRL